MLDSLPSLRKELQKVHGSNKLNDQSKIQKYQKKMLELLIREKTTILQNKRLERQLSLVNGRLQESERSSKSLAVTLKERQQQNYRLKSEIERMSEAMENLDTQNKMNRMGRMSEEEKCAELVEQCQNLQRDKQNLLVQLESKGKEIEGLKVGVEESRQRYERMIHEAEERKAYELAEKDNMIKAIQAKLSQAQSQLQQKSSQISRLQQTQLKQEQRVSQLAASQSFMKQKLAQLQSLLSQSESKCSQLAKELLLAKLKNKQYEESLYSTEIQQGEQSLEFAKVDKENKKLKKDVSLLEEKIAELEEEKIGLEEKNEQLSKNYKNAKRELERIKDTLSEANQYESGVKSRIDKLEQSVRHYKQLLLQKQQQFSSLQQQLTCVQKQSQTYRNESITAKFNLQETKKKYDIVVEARNIAQQKLVLERQENAKSLSSMIKEKDLCYRQNYKLLQLLQVKDKTIEKIFNGLKNVEELEKELCLEVSSKDNHTRRMIEEVMGKEVKGHKERVRVIEEMLQKVKL